MEFENQTMFANDTAAAPSGGTCQSCAIPKVDYPMGVVATLSFFLVLSMVLALGGNVMVILTIARHRGMRTRTNLLLANLAVADILVAVLDMPIALITIIKGKWIFEDDFCFFNGFTVGLGLMLSVHTLMWISIHKFISITKPFSRSVTPRKIVLMIMAAWLWTIFFNLTPLMGLTETVFKLGASQCGPPPPKEGLQYVHAALNTTVNLVIPCCVMSYCYYKIFKEVKDHLSRMQEFADVSVRNSLIQQKQITETLCIVLSVFILFWFPYIIYSLSLVFLGEDNVYPILNPIAYLFGYMNSACNPIIYALRSPSFRRGFTEIICFKTQYMRVNGRSMRSNCQQQVGGMKLSFRGSLWKAQKKNQNNLSIRSERDFRKQAHNLPVGAPKPLPVENQKAEKEPCVSDEMHPVNSDSCGDVKETEMSAGYSCGSEHGNGKYNETSISDTLERVSVDNLVISKSGSVPHELNLVQQEESLYDMEEGEKTGDEVKTMTNMTHKSCEELDLVSRSKRHMSDADGKIEMRKMTSSSQHNVTSLLGNNLNTHIEGRRISNSHREIIVTTAGIMMDQVRSVSAGDVRMPQMPALKRNNIPPPLKLPFENRMKPLLWQASVDNLCGSPVLSRRKIFHIRRVVDSPKAADGVERIRNSSGSRQKKWSISSSSSGRRLGVSALISNVKKSFTDLFNLEGEVENQNVERGNAEESEKENDNEDE